MFGLPSFESSQFFAVDFVLARLNINNQELANVPWRHLRTELLIKELASAFSDLVTTVSGVRYRETLLSSSVVRSTGKRFSTGTCRTKATLCLSTCLQSSLLIAPGKSQHRLYSPDLCGK